MSLKNEMRNLNDANVLQLFPLNLFYRIIWVYLFVGLWVYPFLGLLSNAGLLGLFCFNMSMVTLLYLLGHRLNNWVWGT